MSILKNYQNCFVDKYNNLPLGKYVNLILVRKTESETIFRTEGSGEPLNREYVRAGIENPETIARSVISKRKQTAVERRTGRESLRNYNLLTVKKKDKEMTCMLNTNAPCEKCPDCMIYGYAVGGGGAQKARVITEDAFSILPISLISDTKTFNATYDDGTMRHPITKEASTSLGSSEYVKPETHYLDIQVLKDVTQRDFLYVLANIIRSSRYGAMSSRIGRMKNSVVKVIFSDTEIFSTLELTQSVYDELLKESNELDFPLEESKLNKAINSSTDKLLNTEVLGKYSVMTSEDLSKLHEELRNIYAEPENFLKELAKDYLGE